MLLLMRHFPMRAKLDWGLVLAVFRALTRYTYWVSSAVPESE